MRPGGCSEPKQSEGVDIFDLLDHSSGDGLKRRSVHLRIRDRERMIGALQQSVPSDEVDSGMERPLMEDDGIEVELLEVTAGRVGQPIS